MERSAPPAAAPADAAVAATEAPARTPATPERSSADRLARRLLGLPVDGPSSSIFGAHGAFSRSIAISAARCTFTYLLVPLLGPVVGLTDIGPVLGLLLGAISMVAIVFATRRFFAADHRYRWAYAGVGGAILLLLMVQAGVDVATLLS